MVGPGESGVTWAEWVNDLHVQPKIGDNVPVMAYLDILEDFAG